MNALLRETSEVAVTGNETIEGSIASLREKMGRDHALLATNQVTLSDRIHQSHSTLSEKISSVHHVLRDKIEALGKDLNARLDTTNARIDAVSKSLSDRIDAVSENLNDKIDTVNKDLGTRIDAVSKSLGEKIDKNTVAIADMRGMLKAMVWVVGSAASAAAIVNIGKAFHWF
jgi:DNA anti-recombination protein RmuC